MTTKDANRLRPSAGDTVRVTFESVYRPVWDAPEDGWLVLAEFEGAPWYVRPTEPSRRITSVEVLPPPATAATSAQAPQPAHSPEVGDRVRIVLEGEVAAAETTTAFLRLVHPDSKYLSYPIPTAAAPCVSVEKLPDPEPDYRPGDVVRLNGEHAATYPGQDIFLMHTDYQWRNAYGQDSTDGFMGCDLTPLVRGGETVAAGLGEK